MLTIPPETRSENGNPALRRRPANAETSFTSLNHTALVGQCQTETQNRRYALEAEDHRSHYSTLERSLSFHCQSKDKAHQYKLTLHTGR
ncbi:hypothetical protein EYF80_019285 [Liparis tanakae]|uniref:Uncharacterized protein n=1 Tax=Liparis tanakae TaxID=230148 RepID=A0A4Z2HYE2_9TELE|nr:hypothetical protein EYF80_019285 [Liparis tanakae]